MPTTRTRQIDWTSGEFSEYIQESRVDLEQHNRLQEFRKVLQASPALTLRDSV